MCDWCVTYVEQMQATIASLQELGEPSAPGADRFRAGGVAGKEGRSMIAYKFLRAGRVGPFSAFQWPEPDVWVRAAPELAACRRGIHACRPSDLPWWLADELWEIELRRPGPTRRAQDHRSGRPAALPDRGVDTGLRSGVRRRVRMACARTGGRGPRPRRTPARGTPARSLRDARRRAGRGAPARRRHTRDTDQPDDRRRRCRPRIDRRAAHERIHRRARRDATRWTRGVRSRASLAVAVARRATRVARRSVRPCALPPLTLWAPGASAA